MQVMHRGKELDPVQHPTMNDVFQQGPDRNAGKAGHQPLDPEEAPRAEVRRYDMEFEPSPPQPGATSVGFVRAVAFDSALRRLYAVARALEVGCGVLAGLRPRALVARPLRPPALLAPPHPHQDGRLELLPGRHCFTQVSTA